MWANLHLLFWLTILPFTTGWTGRHYQDALLIATYGANLALCAVAYWLLVKSLLAADHQNELLHRAIGKDIKGTVSVVVYVIAMVLAFHLAWLAQLLYASIAIMWFIPDRRIERLTS